MIAEMTTNTYNQHTMSPNYKASGYITPTANGLQYYQHTSSPSMPHQTIQPMQMPIPVPIMNHHLPRQQQQQQQFFINQNSGVAYNDTGSQAYCNYLYHVGFLQGHFSDVTISIPSISKTFALHSLIVSRSPYLYRRLLDLQQQQDEDESSFIELDYGPALIESFHTIFTHLYRPLSRQDIAYFANEKPQVCLELIDIAEYLEIPLKDMLVHAILSQGFNENSALLWSMHLKQYIIIDSTTSFKKKATSSSNNNNTNSGNVDQQYLKPWVRSIDEHLLQYLTRGLSTKLEAFTTSVKMSGGFTIGKHQAHGYMASKTLPLRGMTELAKIYAKLPWCYLKRCLENPDLPVQDSIQRYLFSKKVFQLRSSDPNKTVDGFDSKAFDEKSIIITLRFDDSMETSSSQNTNVPSSSASSTLSTPTMINSSLNNNSNSNNNNSSANKKKKDEKDSLLMTISLIKSPRRKVGKWDPSLYDLESDDDDDDNDNDK
ncbi:unnamed protein product [Cunninghamella blakesleeana]